MASGYERMRAEARARGEESRVETNQRHLIDKILARYSAEFTIFRELIQNSDDAGATNVDVVFRLRPAVARSPNDSPTPTSTEPSVAADAPLLAQIELSNNGKEFAPPDWKRLQSIAEGNPDPAKIGFFGVGFYSVFSICEEPMVISGPSCLSFHWKSDALFATRLLLPPDDHKPHGATFVFPLRYPSPPPQWAEFATFLASLLTFTRNLDSINVSCDDQRVIGLHRRASAALPVSAVPHWPFALSSEPRGLFTLQSAESRKLTLELVFVPEPGQTPQITTVEVDQHRAHFTTSVPEKLAMQMARVTKKKPAHKCEIACIVASDNRFRHELPGQSHSVSEDLLKASFVPQVSSGKVYIGFPTHQTTGGALHLAAPLIPTVERESIDFVDEALSTWNQEVLIAAGLFTRLLYDQSMTKIHPLFLKEKEPKEIQSKEDLTPKSVVPSPEKGPNKPGGVFRDVFNFVTKTASAVSRVASDVLVPEVEVESLDTKPLKETETHALAVIQSHTFVKSTPSHHVAKLIRRGFLLRPTSPPSLMTTRGCYQADECRLPNGGIESFVQKIPVVRPRVHTACRDFLENVLTKQVGLVTVSDMCRELRTRHLELDEYVRLLKFWIRYKRRRPDQIRFDPELRKSIHVSPDLSLSQFQHYAPHRIFPSILSLPKNTLPRHLTQDFTNKELQEELGWFSPLPVLSWCEFACQSESVLQNEKERNALLVFINEEFRLQKFVDRAQLMQVVQPLLGHRPCLPTTRGLLAPELSYLSSMAALFPDLPKIELTEGLKLSKAFLIGLGVRQFLELDVLFSRLDKLNWDREPTALVKYLASVQDQLRPQDWVQLRDTKFLPLAGKQGQVLMAACELFFPGDTAQALELPALSWPAGHAMGEKSAEKKFLAHLGVQSRPQLAWIINRAADKEFTNDKRLVLLRYLADNLKLFPEYATASLTVAFIPDTDGELRRPRSVFTDTSVHVMRFPIIDDAVAPLAQRLGVPSLPTPAELVAQLGRSSKWPAGEMKSIFDFLSGHCRNFGRDEWSSVRDCAFVPVDMGKRRDTRRKVHEVYARANNSPSTFAQIFDTVDFGTSGNSFLAQCGMRSEPTVDEVCRLILSGPQKLLDQRMAGDMEVYLDLLRQIAGRMNEISPEVLRSLATSPWLLGQRHSQTNFRHLCQASTCSLVDDTILEQLFDPMVIPSDFGLEKLCLALGTKWLSQEVVRKFSWNGDPRETPLSRELELTIQERAPLLLTSDSRRLVSSNAATMLGGNLKCRQVDAIECMLSFRGATRGQRTTSYATRQKTMQPLTVYITASMDFFDVGQALARFIFPKGRLEDTFLVAQILETPLPILRSRGFPVDRVIKPPSPPPTPPPPPQATPHTPPIPAVTCSSPSSQATKSNGKGDGQKKSPPTSEPVEKRPEDGFVEILGNMFPHCDQDYLKSVVSRQSKDHLLRASNLLAQGDYPKNKKAVESKESEGKSLSKRLSGGSNGGSNTTFQKLKQAIGRGQGTKGLAGAFGGDGGSFGGGPGIGQRAPNPIESNPVFDKDKAQQMDRVLHQAAQSCKKPPKSMSAADTVIPVSKELTSSSPSCEIVPGHDLEACRPPGAFGGGRCLRVFQKRGTTVALDWESCARFSVVLRGLGRNVFDVPEEAMSIYNDAGGRTIAFNAGRSLHFNLRYFRSLHGELDTSRSVGPWSYWFVVFCHELAHNFVGEHDQRHEYYMEAFAQRGIPRLTAILPR